MELTKIKIRFSADLNYHYFYDIELVSGSLVENNIFEFTSISKLIKYCNDNKYQIINKHQFDEKDRLKLKY